MTSARSLAFPAIALALAGACGCASSLRVMTGTLEKKRVALSAVATIEASAARVALTVDNRSDDPIGIELDAVGLRDGAGTRHGVLGRPQGVRSGGSKQVVRVALGATTVEPHGRTEVALEFDKLPPASGLTLLVPALYRLGIEGQSALKPIELPLALDAPATAEAERAAFYDPFADE